jgi:hypothetical protein
MRTHDGAQLNKGIGMPIPNDLLQREWIECAGVNPGLVSQFRPVLVSFWAAKGVRGGLAGSGFLIGGNADMGLVITAKHVLSEMAVDIQQPKKRHAPSALAEFLPPSSTLPKIGKGSLAAIWANDAHAQALNIAFAGYDDSSDLACCLIVPDANFGVPFVPVAAPINTEVPKPGDVVHMVSWNEMAQQSIDRTEHPEAISYALNRTLSIRRGTVTGIYVTGYRQYKWPCFTTSIPAEPGMSGGLVYLPKDGGTLAACGVVCADNSDQDARRDEMRAGESVIGLSYLALALKLPVETRDDSPLRTLQQMMRDGDLPPAINGFEQFRFLAS